MYIDAGVDDLKNNPLHILIIIVLCIIILGGIKIPADILSVTGSVPGIIITIGLVFYLFTVSPILGVFGMMAGYGIVMNQFQVTLEEQLVKNIVPLVQSVTPKHLNFKYTEDNTYSAANAI